VHATHGDANADQDEDRQDKEQQLEIGGNGAEKRALMSKDIASTTSPRVVRPPTSLSRSG
jgi:hypothetical protein